MFQIFAQLLVMSTAVDKKLLIPVFIELLLICLSQDGKLPLGRHFRQKPREEN